MQVSSRGVVIALVVVGLILAVAIGWRRGAIEPPAVGQGDGRAAVPTDPDEIRMLLARVEDDASGMGAGGGGDPLGGVDVAAAWAEVDLEAVRDAMPENLYWEHGAPTDDPDVLARRADERARRNLEYGKVLSNTATAEEVDAYYAHQELLSSDYLEFVVHVLTHYGDVLPVRDRGLLKLAGEMHLARLEEIPRKTAEAHERREAHEQARQAWLADQEAFAAEPTDAR